MIDRNTTSGRRPWVVLLMSALLALSACGGATDAADSRSGEAASQDRAQASAAAASDFTQGVDFTGSAAKIWFKSNVATTWVDVHYQVNGGEQQNVRMGSANGRFEQALTVSSGQTLSYFFTYDNGGPAYDSPRFSYTVGASTPPPGPSPAQAGAVCFYEHDNYNGQSFCADADSAWIGTVWNDRVTSVKVTAGYRLDLFDDVNYGGRTLTLQADTANLGQNFNDIVSSFRISRSTVVVPPSSDSPDFGPNVTVFEPGTPSATIQAKVDAAFNSQLRSPTAQFGGQRPTFLFKPGRYSAFINLGFYTSVIGLGQNPDDVTIQGAVNADSGWNFGDERNATQNFWRAVENVAVEPNGGTNRWAVSQAAPMRRVHIRGNLVMGPSNQDFGQGYSSGGYIADSKIDGVVATGSQQQWYTRDSNVGQWFDGVWNMVFSGVVGAPGTSFPKPPYTTLATTPVSRDKPYLYVDNAGKYRVFVPALRTNASGASWANGPTAGTSLPMSQFFVAKPSDSAATINAALAQGRDLFLLPGTYRLAETLRVTRANTVVLGLGFPTLVPENGIDAMLVSDVDGVRLAGLLFDAGTVNSKALLVVGPPGSSARHAGNPITVQDVYFRIGGSAAGKATTSLIVNSSDTIIDHIWAWRADHGGAPTGWNINTADTGVIVNGANVLATALFVEHYQKYQVIWNGENGKTLFFQSEMPYDVPNQAAWNGPRGNGYASYKVADNVRTHEGWGLGSYCFFNIGGVNTNLNAARGFEVPDTPGVRLRSVLTVSLGGNGTITNVVNNTGAMAQGVATIPSNVVAYP
jgi:Peptidase inhibitor family I36